MNKTSNARPIGIDLFAGAGGLSEGLREAGFRSLYANEISSRYAQTYAVNHPNTQVDSRDIRKVDSRKIRDLLANQPRTPVAISARVRIFVKQFRRRRVLPFSA